VGYNQLFKLTANSMAQIDMSCLALSLCITEANAPQISHSLTFRSVKDNQYANKIPLDNGLF
jgi:hypothetical protein